MNQRAISSNSNDIVIDRISELPEFLLQNILSFLPTKEAARSCLVSKPWLHAWSTRSFLHFDRPSFASIDKETFFELVDNTLAKYDREGLSINKFTLEVNVDEDASIHPIIDKWLTIVLRNKVQNLTLFTGQYPRYLLPVFTSNSLTVLVLFQPRFVLNDTQFSRFPNLKKLALFFVFVTDQTIQNLASCCPLLEEFHLSDCFGLQQIYVANLINLKIFSCSLCYYIGEEVRIEAPKLQSFRCWDYNIRSNCRLIIEPYHNLKSFFVSNSTSITDKGLCDLLSHCPLLEDLSLYSCYLLERIHVASHSLKRLRLQLDLSPWSNTVVEVTVDAPNLCSLVYHDYKLSYLSLVSPLVLAQAKSSIRAGYYENLNAEWFCKLGSLLKSFKTSDLTLCASTPETEEFIAVPCSPVHEVEVLNLSMENQVSLPFRFLVSGLFSSCHPKMILVVWDNDQEEFIQCLFNELLWRRSFNCWGSDGVSCWWHYLEDAKVEILSKTRGKWIQLDRKRFQASSMNLECGSEIRFTLKWCAAEEY